MIRYIATLILALASFSAMAVKPNRPIDPFISTSCAPSMKAAAGASIAVSALTGVPQFGAFTGLTVALYRESDRCAVQAAIAGAVASGVPMLIMPKRDGAEVVLIKRF